ncbi:MAG: hypothetical protein SO046_06095 [Actinomyces urogenitalis]|uniref:hypothetical protein n=1 Tax=Actinomyces urogenitalis TaxID=103621 RepID=UPI002A7F2EA8|nr:hypothetical protein [Actinomyces urogenitalis]MDY3678767.1 hypothetical protein [Actinomyces urogenitalis]
MRLTHRRVPAASAALCLVALLIAACSAPASGPTRAEPEASPSQVDWLQAWRDWRPATAVRPRTYSRDEAMELRATWLESARHDDVPKETPIPDLISWSDGADQEILQCLNEAGFQARQADPSGGIIVDGLAEAQSRPYHQALWTCSAQYTPSPEQLQPWGEEQYSVLYEYYTTFYLPCLKRQGIDLAPSADIPTQEAWVTHAMSGQNLEHLWMPTDSTQWDAAYQRKVSDQRVWDLLAQECPPKPPASALYG